MKARLTTELRTADHDGDDSSPGRTARERESGSGDDHTEDEVHPSPGRVVDLDHQSAVSHGK